MTIRNNDWYNLNQQRPWPLDDAATLVDAGGQHLPHDLLADLQLRWPSEYGERAWLSALTISPQLVTAIFLSASGSYQPLASFQAIRPLDDGRHYDLAALAPGVGGWIVLGAGVERITTTQTYRFTAPSQSLLQLRSAQYYKPLPVRSLGKLQAASGLLDLVRLEGGNDIEIVRETREIEGVLREAAVLRLVDDFAAGFERNLFEEYGGPCGRRPESRNCGTPEPIEYINNVAPDCCGQIIIEIHGCAAISRVENDGCGVVLDCGFGLTEACAGQNQMPDEDGNLPGSGEDVCSSISSEVPGPEDEDPTSPEYIREHTSYSLEEDPPEEPVTSLPYQEFFEDADHALEIVQGSFTTTEGVYRGDPSQPNLALVSDEFDVQPGWSTLRKQIRTVAELQLGARANFGLVCNYRPASSDPSVSVYWLVDVDWEAGPRLYVRRYTGSGYTTEAAVLVPGIAVGQRYRLTVTIEAVAESSPHAWLRAQLEGLDNPELDVTLGPVLLVYYAPADGRIGLWTNASSSHFDCLGVLAYDASDPPPSPGPGECGYFSSSSSSSSLSP